MCRCAGPKIEKKKIATTYYPKNLHGIVTLTTSCQCRTRLFVCPCDDRTIHQLHLQSAQFVASLTHVTPFFRQFHFTVCSVFFLFSMVSLLVNNYKTVRNPGTVKKPVIYHVIWIKIWMSRDCAATIWRRYKHFPENGNEKAIETDEIKTGDDDI